MADLEFDVDNHVATIRLNRPHRKNAFTLEMVDPWVDALTQADRDPNVRAIILTGTGDAFCSGVDLDARRGDTADTPLGRRSILSDHVHRILRTVEGLRTPLIGAINGTAVGAGLDMALMCDVRVMAASARVWEGYILAGLLPGDGGCYFLPRIVGTSLALEMLWTGRRLTADEAFRYGLVNHVYEDDEFDDQTQAFAAKIASRPPVAIQMIKRAVWQSWRSDLATSLDLIASQTGVVAFMDDTREAMDAFRNGRDGKFSGK